MYKKILVPLDGSELASAILPHVREIVRCTRAHVTLLRATPPSANHRDDVNTHDPQSISAPPRAMYSTNWYLKATPDKEGERIEHEVETAQKFLDDVAAELAKSGIHARTVVQPGAAAETILDVADREEADLITMSTHGRSGIGRFLMGSVTDRVVHYAKVPVLVMRPNPLNLAGASAAEVAYKRVLVPLDGSRLALEVLPYVSEMAKNAGAELLLLRVSPSPADWPDEEEAFVYSGGLVGVGRYAATNESIMMHHELDTPPDLGSDTERARRVEHARESAQATLNAAAAELTQTGLRVETLIQMGKPADTILDVAKSCGADLIAMSTHGRSGLRRFLMGSVAGRVLGYTDTPVLLVRAQAK